ncbi:hypothetical protein LSM04_009190 [Trypanosoma melophagium]|uniref:uncharacterized protein n=1 Tax=Trypanosoma melophagium TaxID=715481 RepID=UPI003519FF64|nr:hypothetical protein LSM04_009190 [Trypanosoma melophagium]
MRRALRANAVQLPWVLGRASRFYTAGGDAGFHNQGRERKRDGITYDVKTSGKTMKGGNTRLSSNINNRKLTSGMMGKPELLFPDAQEHDMDDTDVAVEEGGIGLGEKNESRQQQEEEVRAPPNIKRRYEPLVRPKRETVVLTTSFSSKNATKSNAATAEEEENNDEDDDDVTKIYDSNEMENIVTTQQVKQKHMLNLNSECQSVAKSKMFNNKGDDDHDHKAAEKKISRDKVNISEAEIYEYNKKGVDVTYGDGSGGTRNHSSAEEAKIELDRNVDDAEDEVVANQIDGNDELRNLKNHPFFNDLLRRMEKNAVRQRPQIKAAGCYNIDAINLCLRPLLQLTDYPFTTSQLKHTAPFIYPKLLKRSLSDLKACRRLHIYYSPDTDVILDWSSEDFLRRRYESIHLSWEPVKIVMMRFGWNQEVMSDRDCLLYFSKFRDFIELAELELSAGDDKPKAIPIEDPVRIAEQRPISVSKLLIRRKLTEETEPSITESIRLMGTPALSQPAKSRKSQSLEKDSLQGTFERIQREAASVDGDEKTKLQHGMSVVPSLRQASHPSGRSIKTFSLGKPKSTVIEDKVKMHTPTRMDSNAFDEGQCTYTPEKYEALANAYHKKKVEASQMRRRLLSTDSIDQASELQKKLAQIQKELPRLREQLEKMRKSRHMEKEDTSMGSYTSFLKTEKNDSESQMKNKTSLQPEITETGERISVTDENQEDIKKNYDSIPFSTSLHMETTKDPKMKNSNAAEENMIEKKLIDEKCESQNGFNQPLQNSSIPSSKEIETLSSAALMLRREIESLQEKRRIEENALLRKMEEALSALHKIESTIISVSERETKEAEAEAERQRLEIQRKEEAEKKARREEAEARAHALEQELLHKHEERMKLLNKQREEAQQAQREAEFALERQKQLEQATLKAQEELQRNLQEAKSKIWSEEPENDTPIKYDVPIATLTLNNGSKTVSEQEVPATSVTSSSDSFSNNTTSSFSSEPSCTPEQYDGLCLAGERLRKEIAELERQMENEGDEDDMTLMAVLAASRADLEELEDFINVVRRKESWTAERDRIRKEEKARLEKEKGTNSNDLQESISAIRFQIELMEKRLQHATERSVITKLEQGIINGRREINKLRMEQDRLRRSGQQTNAGGIHIPPSLSLAEAIAEEQMEAKNTEEIMDIMKKNDTITEDTNTNNIQSSNYAHDENDNGDSAMNLQEEEEETMMEEVENHKKNKRLESEDINSGVFAEDSIDEDCNTDETDSCENLMKSLQGDQQELKQLTTQMEKMLEEIKCLEDGIASKEDGENAEITATSLVELQKKLQQLLKLRDAVKQRMMQTSLEEETNSSKKSTSSSTDVSKKKTHTSTTTSVSKPASTPRRPVVLAPLSNRPVSSHTNRAGGEVLHFEHHIQKGQQQQQRGSVAGRKMQKATKTKKARR